VDDHRTRSAVRAFRRAAAARYGRAVTGAIRRFRYVSLAEGVSYLVLLGIAMPLKYAAGMPGAVRVVGMAHGVLFVAYVVALAWAARAARWPISKSAVAMVASIVPLGAFWLERRLRREEAAARDGQPPPIRRPGATDRIDAP
jgi:integral membrane protein